MWLGVAVADWANTVAVMIEINAAERAFGDRYRILASLGTSSVAGVFLAEDIALNRRVALKVFAEELAADEVFLERFEAVAASAVTLNHPHLVTAYEWGLQPFCHLVTEYLAGGSLQTLLDAGCLLSRSQALLVSLETSRALEYVHSKGLAHLGVKPSNLLFDRKGRLHLADFGLASALTEAGREDSYGSAAPELSHNKPLSTAFDVYCLALVIVEAITGESLPFIVDRHSDQVEAKMTADAEVVQTNPAQSASSSGSNDDVGAKSDSSSEVAAGDAGGDVVDGDLLVTHPGIPSEFRSALGPLWYALDRVTEPVPADRPSVAKVAGDLLSAAEMLPRPEPLPIMKVESAAHPGLSGETDLLDAGLGSDSDTTSPTEQRTQPKQSASKTKRRSPSQSPSAEAHDLTAASMESKADAPSPGIKFDTLDKPSPDRSLSDQIGIPPDDPLRRRWPGWILTLTVFLICAGLGFQGWLASRADSHRVPDLAGVTRDEALAAVSRFGWDIEETLLRVEELIAVK